jgi:hypothetical protein
MTMFRQFVYIRCNQIYLNGGNLANLECYLVTAGALPSTGGVRVLKRMRTLTQRLTKIGKTS